MSGFAVHFRSPRANDEAALRLAQALGQRGAARVARQALGAIELVAAGRGSSAPQLVRRGDRCLALDGDLDTARLREAGGEGETAAERALDLFARRGAAALPALAGPFALAFWDGETLLLARDRLGQRPLCWAVDAQGFWAGSDAALLRAGGAAVGGLDRAALSDYLELLCVPAPRSIWSNVHKLVAGHRVAVREGAFDVARFAPALVPGGEPARAADDARVRELLDAALVRDRGAAGCAVVSGGPSSWGPLLALAGRTGGRQVVALSVAAAQTDRDAALAKALATHAGAEVREAALQGKLLLDAQGVLSQAPEPLGDASALATTAALLASGRDAVVLSSHGGAPVFADADRYRTAGRVPTWRRLGRAAELLGYIAPRRHRARLSRAAHTLQAEPGSRVRSLAEAFLPEDRRALLHSEARTAPLGASHPDDGLDAALAFDLDVLLPERFLPALWFSAAYAGAQARTPYLDDRVVDAVVPLRAKEKLRGGGLLHRAVAGAVPEGLLSRSNPGAPPPLRGWLSGPFRIQLDDLLRAPTARIRTVFDPRGVDRLLEESLRPQGDPRLAWGLFMLESWLRGPGQR